MNVQQLIDQLERQDQTSDVTIGTYDRNMGIVTITDWDEELEAADAMPRPSDEPNFVLILWDDAFCAGCDEPYDEENYGPDMGPDHRPYGQYLTAEKAIERLKLFEPTMRVRSAGMGGLSFELFEVSADPDIDQVIDIGPGRIGMTFVQ